MSTVIVVRHIPPQVVGICGPVVDQLSATFEGDLDWLEATGIPVERIDPLVHPEHLSAVAQAAWQAEGLPALPMITIGGRVVSRSATPSRTQLAHLVSQTFQRPLAHEVVQHLAALAAAAALGDEPEVARKRAEARDLEIEDEGIETAIATGRHVAQEHQGMVQ